MAFSSGANVLSGEFLATFRGLHGGSIFPRRATSTCPLALPPELDVGRTVGPARFAGLAVQSLLPSGTHVPCPDRTRLCRARDYPLSLSLSFSRRPQHPAVPESPRINRGDSPRAKSPEKYLVASTRFRTIRSFLERRTRLVLARRDEWRKAPVNSVVRGTPACLTSDQWAEIFQFSVSATCAKGSSAVFASNVIGESLFSLPFTIQVGKCLCFLRS